jgi:hypothetical protein
MLPLRSRSLMLPGILTLTLLALPAYSAVVTTYTSMASWQAAANNLTAIDFASQTLGALPTSGLTISFIQFTEGAAYAPLAIVDTSAPPNSTYYDFGTGYALQLGTSRADANQPVPYIHMVLPSATTAISFNLFTAAPNGFTFTVTALGTQYSAPTFSKPTLAFWGITSDTAIPTLDLTLQGTVFNGGNLAFVDNIKFGAADAPVPEAATCVTIGSGLLVVGLFRKRRGPPLAAA